MRKVILLLLFSLPGLRVLSASVFNTKEVLGPHPKPTRVSDPFVFRETIKDHFKLKNQIAKLRQAAFKKSHSTDPLPADTETRRWKKVLSIIALSLGVSSLVLALTIGPVVLVLSGAAVITGLISLEKNKSKPHRFMALAGVLLGLFCIGSVYALSTLF